MPTITDPHLLSVLQWCDDWIEITRSEIEDIGAWRGVAWKYDFSHRPRGLHRIAIGLSQHVTTAYPSLSPTAIHDTYTHIEMWYKDQSESNLPPQSVLESTLERSLFVAASVRDDILVKAGAYDGANANKAGGSNWQFPHDGTAIYKQIDISITGIRWKLLRTLAKSTDPLSSNDLIEAAWAHDSDATADNLKPHISAIRNLLRRKVMHDKNVDPIPHHGRSTTLTWSLDSSLR